MNNNFDYNMYNNYHDNYNKTPSKITHKKQNKLMRNIIIALVGIVILILTVLIILNSNILKVKVIGVKIIESSIIMTVDETKILKAIVLPSDATNQKVKWSSDNELVVTVDQNGMIMAKSPGIANITVNTVDGDFKDDISITVKPKIISVNNVKIDNSSFELEIGESKTLSATISPSNATNKEIQWSSSNEKIATIDENGKVVAKEQGTATIIAKSVDGDFKDSISVTVKPKFISVSDIQIAKKSLVIEKGKSENIAVTILPTNATNKIFTCESKNQNIAAASVNGNSCRINGIGIGTTQVIVFSHDKKNNEVINVTVEEAKKIVNINVATWNIHRYRDANRNLIAEKMATLNLDIIGLQETRTYGNSSSQEENGSKYALGEIGKKIGLNNNYYTHTPAGNAILSNKSFISNNSYGLSSCHETRSLQKTVINVNNINISFYNTHLSYQTNCPQIQLESVYNIIKNDVNPVILVGDFNVGPSTILNNTLGSDYKIIAHDTNRQIYADSIIMNGKGKLKYVDGSAKTIVTTGVLSDHNLVMATISVVN